MTPCGDRDDALPAGERELVGAHLADGRFYGFVVALAVAASDRETAGFSQACGPADLARCLSTLQEAGVWTMGAAGETSTGLYDLDLRGSLALVMGAEGSGLRRLTRERCDQLYAIPMVGGVESLNVSVAAGISLYEALRQRQ